MQPKLVHWTSLTNFPFFEKIGKRVIATDILPTGLSTHVAHFCFAKLSVGNFQPTHSVRFLKHLWPKFYKISIIFQLDNQAKFCWGTDQDLFYFVSQIINHLGAETNKRSWKGAFGLNKI